MMVTHHRLTIVLTLGTAAVVFVSFVAARNVAQWTTLAHGETPLTFLCIWTLAAIPIAFAMPRIRARFFGRMWRVPRDAYVLPRWMVCICIGAMFGQVAGFLVLTILRDYRLLGLAGSAALICGAFCAGAWRRLKKRPATEFTMRWWPPM
jgi:hypothetical protein